LDRNTLLAFALSMIVFVSYLMYQEQRRAEFALEAEQLQQEEAIGAEKSVAASDGPPDAPADAQPSAPAPEPAARPEAPRTSRDIAEMAPPVEPARDIPHETIQLENDDVVARIGNGPGLIESWQLRHYEERVENREIPVELIGSGLTALRTGVVGVPGDFEQTRFEIVAHGPRSVIQRAHHAVGTLTRTLRLDEHGYGFDLELAFERSPGAPADANFEIVWPAEKSARADFNNISLMAYGEEDGVTRTLVPGVGKPGLFGLGGGADGREIIEGRARWAGFDVQYFAGVVIDPSEEPRLKVRFEAIEEGESAETRVTLPSVALRSGGTMTDSLRGFLGPKEPDVLSAVGEGLQHSVNRGWSWIEPLTRFFEIALDWLYRFIPNYGLAIIVLTILVRIFTAPLMAKQMRSAERMREMQPKMKALQERYKDDRQKLSEETMRMYREEKINPFAGCLPLLLQFPVLIGLFYALRSSIGLRHAPFALWITDLSQPATLFVLPGLDFPVRLLPLIMGASMFAQQKMTPTTGMDPTQARMMLIMMPAMMLFISYTFPSGLVLYWTVSNLLGIAQQYWIRGRMQPAS
jgi:YidC/Oxa1 family membrane protein insertase